MGQCYKTWVFTIKTFLRLRRRGLLLILMANLRRSVWLITWLFSKTRNSLFSHLGRIKSPHTHSTLTRSLSHVFHTLTHVHTCTHLITMYELWPLCEGPSVEIPWLHQMFECLDPCVTLNLRNSCRDERERVVTWFQCTHTCTIILCGSIYDSDTEIWILPRDPLISQDNT